MKKRLMIFLLIGLMLSMVFTACTKKTDTDQKEVMDNTNDNVDTAVPGEITGSIAQADTATENLDVDDVDTEIENLDKELADW